jgi:hypothetical protein
MPAFICATCGVQHAPSEVAPSRCQICADERQYVPPGGQRWTTVEELHDSGQRIVIRDLEPGLTGIGAEPKVGIGQRSLLLQTAGGNLLWDCFGYIDEPSVAAVRGRGGLGAIAMSHPHFYGVCVEWSHAFDHAPIYIPQADRDWVMRPDAAIRYWQERAEPVAGVSLIQCGGHFEGSSVVHWQEGSGGKGALLTGDSITVVADRRFVTFMRSYPNQIPMSAQMVRHIVDVVRPYRFDRIYGGWWESVVEADGQAAVERSAERYIRWIEGDTVRA